MTDFWKSNERKYCDFCKCWLSENKTSVAFHESGKRHKANVAKRISDISRSSEKAEQERQKMDAQIRKMEEAAMRSYTFDIHARGDLTARSIGTVIAATSAASTSASGAITAATSSARRQQQVDPMRLPGNSDDEGEDGQRVFVRAVQSEDVPNASLWVEGKSDDGYTYYWNVKTNESVWEEPKEGYLSWTEYQRINELALKQQEIQEANEAKHFRENANEEVARFNREKLKKFRRADTPQEKEAKRVERERKQAFKTEDEAATQEIGSWQVVETKPPPAPIDWELPKLETYTMPPVVTEAPAPPPPVKRFKEKIIVQLDPELTSDTSTTFKKRKFAAKGNARKRLDDDYS